MMQILRRPALLGVLVLAILTAPAAARAEDKATASYLYNLANFDGIVPYSSVKLAVDRGNDEVYVLSGEAVTVFNSSGMEIFQLDYDPKLGPVYDAAFKPDGNILFLAYLGTQFRIALCDYRGDILTFIGLKDLPPEFADFSPNRMLYRDGRLYFASLNSMQVIVTDGGGSFLKGYDIAALLDMSDQQTADSGMTGFSLGDNGDILFVVSASAQVYRLAPDGTLAGFGRRGSGPGKFGVPTSVATDRNGNYLVSDRLRCVILVFDKDFKFVTEFGFRGLRPGNLVVPGDLVVDNGNRVYVSQLRRRGVNVYQLRYE